MNGASAGLRARCNQLSRSLVQCWNRRTAVEHELESPHLTAARGAYLTTRRQELCEEQDRLEVQMTRAAAALVGAEIESAA